MNNYCYDNRRIYTFYHEAKSILSGGLPRPRMTLIYPSRICNHSCYYCSDRWGNSKINAIMQRDKFLELPERLKKFGIECCELCGGGEPLLHPDIVEFIERCKKYNLKLASLTNGTMIKGRLLELMVDYFSYIRVSIDTFDEDIYNIMRRPKSKDASLVNVLRNIKNAVKLKKRLNAPIQIGVKMCIDKDNIKDIRTNVKKAEDLMIDSIQIKLARNSGKSSMPKYLLRKGEESIEWCKKNIKDVIVLGGLDMQRIDHKCWLSPCHIFIDTTGEVRICCYYQFREKAHTYGNIFKDNIESIWFGRKHKKALKEIQIEECNKWDCKYFSYNKIMKDALINDRAQWQFV